MEYKYTETSRKTRTSSHSTIDTSGFCSLSIVAYTCNKCVNQIMISYSNLNAHILGVVYIIRGHLEILTSACSSLIVN